MPVHVQKFISGEALKPEVVKPDKMYVLEAEKPKKVSDVLVVDSPWHDGKADVFLAEGVSVPDDKAEREEFFEGLINHENHLTTLRQGSDPETFKLEDKDVGRIVVNVLYVNYPKPMV